MEKDITLVALFAALIAALGLLPQLQLGFGVPITMQSLGVMLAGTVLGAKRGGLAALLFIALVALGLPLLAGGRGGIGVFASPTAGFALGFPIAAFVVGLATQSLRRLPIGVAAGVGGIIGGVLALYLCGVIGFMAVTGKTLSETLTLFIAFIPGDAAKAVLAGVITATLAKARPASVLTRG
ncbi:MAG: biotin transporter BioY [Sulfitobacter sp.]